MSKYHDLEKGDKIEFYEPRGYNFHVDEFGYVLLLNEESPSDEEIARIDKDKNFAMAQYHDDVDKLIMFWMFKLDDKWIAVPFDPTNNADISVYKQPPDGDSSILKIIIVDSDTNIVRNTRNIRVERYLTGFYYQIMHAIESNPYYMKVYYGAVTRITSEMTPEDMAFKSKFDFKIRGFRKGEDDED